MRTSEQIKGKVKHFAKMNHLNAQEVLQMYFLNGFSRDWLSHDTKMHSFSKAAF